MADFDDLFDDLVPQGTATFTLDRVHVRSDKPLVLVMRHAGDANPAYKSLRTRLAKELASHSQRGDAEATTALMIRVYAQTVIVGWENCNGKDGQPMPYTPAKGIELLERLVAKARDEVDAAFLYAANADHFRGSPVAAAEMLGK